MHAHVFCDAHTCDCILHIFRVLMKNTCSPLWSSFLPLIYFLGGCVASHGNFHRARARLLRGIHPLFAALFKKCIKITLSCLSWLDVNFAGCWNPICPAPSILWLLTTWRINRCIAYSFFLETDRRSLICAFKFTFWQDHHIDASMKWSTFWIRHYKQQFLNENLISWFKS